MLHRTNHSTDHPEPPASLFRTATKLMFIFSRQGRPKTDPLQYHQAYFTHGTKPVA
jgi:hypothetical protein